MTTNTTELPVYLRIRPKPASGASKNTTRTSDSYLRIIHGTNEVEVDPPKGSKYKAEEKFSFSGVFKESTGQLEIYKNTVLSLVENVLLNKKDSLFFTMGPSGSGKSHTILGYKQTPGMIQLSIDTMFKSIGKNLADFEAVECISDKNHNRVSSAIEAGLFLDWTKTNAPKVRYSNNSMCDEIFPLEDDEKYSYAVYISMIEIYNDRVFNLLEDSDTKPQQQKQRRGLTVKSDSETGKSYVSDVQKIYVSERAEAYRVIEKGLAIRKANSTGLNDFSSRSHAFITIEVKRIPKKKSLNTSVTSSSLTIVDLAGSERNKTAQTVGSRLTESCAINKSLMLLGQCLQKQRDREKTTNTPTTANSIIDSSIFRNCKLTQLLLSNTFLPKNQDHEQKTQILVTVDPYSDFNSSAQILRYSALARTISVPNNNTRVVSSSSNNSSTTLAEEEDSTRSFSSTTEYEDESNSVLLDRIQQLEKIATEATEKCLTIEEETRQEMAVEMEKQIQELESQYLDRIDDDLDRNQNVTDKKIDILTKSIRQEERAKVQTEMERLIKENDDLRRQLKHVSG